MYVEHACMYVEHASSKGGGDTSKTPLPVRVFDDSTKRTSIKYMISEGPQKLIHKDTILILVYIHTYILTFARRINIDFNSSATLRNEIPKRTCLGIDFQQQK